MDAYPQAAVDSLFADLFVSDSQPPLSIAAASAVMSLRNNVFESVGGSVTAFELESSGTRFGSLDGSMSAFARLGDIPLEQPGPRSMLVHLNVEPTWLQHKYFCTKLKE